MLSEASQIANMSPAGTKTKPTSSILHHFFTHPSPSGSACFYEPSLLSVPPSVLSFLSLTFLPSQPTALTSYSFFPSLCFSSPSYYLPRHLCSLSRLLTPLRHGFRLSSLALFLVSRERRAELSWTVSGYWPKKQQQLTQQSTQY